LFSALQETIDDSSVKEVDGFVIPITTDNFKFISPCYLESFRKDLEPNEIIPNSAINFGTPEIGSYTINYIGSNKDYYAFHFPMGTFGILYQRLNNGIFKPQVLKMDEMDFCDYLLSEKKITAAITMQSGEETYIQKGIFYSEKSDFIKAINYFTNGINGIINGLLDHNDSKIRYESIYEFAVKTKRNIETVGHLYSLLSHRMNASYKIGDYLQAIKDSTELLSFNKNDILAIQFKTRALQNLNESEQAFELIEKELNKTVPLIYWQ
jgi:tetratricopeptide (TPR) repeat protein